jgi:NAD(P)-dependent dehydrogenase (short-subunit alcohol dehydrogenase family)/pimeloyl-ACP methyl ester carboxylesterase
MSTDIKPPQAQTLRVRSGEVELAVKVYGAAGQPARQPVIVLVHGYPDSSQVWHKVVGPLSARYRVAAYDVRGAGDSSAPAHTAAYELDHLVADLAAVADAVSPEQPIHLVAHDWGSIQGWEAVSTARLRGRIASFTSISGPSLDHAGYWVMQRLRSGAPGELAKFANQLMHSWYIGAFHLPLAAPLAWKLGLDQLWPRLLERFEGIHTESSPSQTRDGQQGLNLYRANVARRLLAPRERRTSVPVQLVVPTRDRFVSLELLEGIEQWVERLWRRDVGAGHWLQLSHPELVVRYVSEFVDFTSGGEEPAGLHRAQVRGFGEAAAKGRYAGKLAIVTGGGSGIGRETLLALAEQGAEVVAADIDLAAARRSAELAELLGATAHARKVDVGDAKAMEAFAAWVAAELGAPDLVVNNAGIGMAGSFLDTSTADWDKILHVNLWGVIHGSRLFGKQMVAAGKGGHIVNVASALAFTPTRMLAAYATTKAAVAMLSDCLRAELAGQGIQVISVCPGVIDTPITGSTRFVGVSEEEQKRRRDGARRLYQRRNLKPQAVAAAILKAIEQRKPEVLVGSEAHGARLLSRLSPALTRRLARMELSL